MYLLLKVNSKVVLEILLAEKLLSYLKLEITQPVR